MPVQVDKSEVTNVSHVITAVLPTGGEVYRNYSSLDEALEFVRSLLKGAIIF